MMLGIVVWGVVAISAAVLAGIFAGYKNRDVGFWAAWCFLVPPLVLWIMLMPVNAGPRPRRPSLDEEDRQVGML